MRGLLIFLADKQATPSYMHEYTDYTRSHLSTILGQMVKLTILERTSRWDGGSKFTFYKLSYRGKLLLEAHGYIFGEQKPELKEFLKEMEKGS